MTSEERPELRKRFKPWSSKVLLIFSCVWGIWILLNTIIGQYSLLSNVLGWVIEVALLASWLAQWRIERRRERL